MSGTVAMADLNQIVQDVMSSFAGDVTPGPGRHAGRDVDTWLEAWVKISGAWDGEVVLAVLGASAPELAAAMLGVSTDEVTTDDSVDALCELVNMIGGQVKGTLPPGCRLSLPLIRMMRRDTAGVLTGGREVATRTFDWSGHPLTVTVRASS
jgi:hypothetical protein